jgi:enoyl-CoA hydratase/carnithine racemase
MSEQVIVTREAGVCEVRLNRPDKRNAITVAMYQALGEALQAAQTDGGVRAVLFSGEGPSFCAGNDLNDFLSAPQIGADHPVLTFLRRLVSCEKPLVAAVHGQTVGIGVTMLLHCDLVLAAQGAQLSMPFVALGLVPEAGSTLLLPRLIGQQRAAHLLLLGRPLDAAAAHALGLVTELVEESELLQTARERARELTQQPLGALSATRRLLRGDPAPLQARILEEARIFSAQLQSEEFRAGIRAFLARGRTRPSA